MNKQDWFRLTGNNPIDSHWEVIEKVYMYHPSIPEVNGKKVLAELYKVGGMGLINDMLHTAKTAQEYERKLEELRVNIQNMQSDKLQYEKDFIAFKEFYKEKKEN